MYSLRKYKKTVAACPWRLSANWKMLCMLDHHNKYPAAVLKSSQPSTTWLQLSCWVLLQPAGQAKQASTWKRKRLLYAKLPKGSDINLGIKFTNLPKCQSFHHNSYLASHIGNEVLVFAANSHCSGMCNVTHFHDPSESWWIIILREDFCTTIPHQIAIMSRSK